MITFEALDVILRVQNLPAFQARMRAGAKSVSLIGKAAVDTNKKASAAIYAAAKKATLALTALTAISVATGVKQSIEFEKQITLLHTQAGRSKKEMNFLREGILDLAKDSRQAPIELAKAMYGLSSIGMPTDKLLQSLKVTSEGAAVGLANVEDTTNAVAGAWLAGIDGAKDFDKAMAIMSATAGAGNVRMQDLVVSMGTGVLPAAKTFGLTMYDVMGALALLTDEGYGAYGAMAQLATSLYFIGSPTQKARKAMKQMGLDELELAETMRKEGLIAALSQLDQALKDFSDDPAKQRDMLSAILPGGRGRVLVVLKNQLEQYRKKVEQIKKAEKQYMAGESIKATKMTAAYRIESAWARVQRALIILGDVFRNTFAGTIVWALELFADFLTFLAGIPAFVEKMKKAWEAVPTPIKAVLFILGSIVAQYALIFFALVMLAKLRLAWLAIRGAMLTVRALMIVMFAAGGGWTLLIMAVIGAIALMILHWEDTKKIIADIWDYIQAHDWAKVLLGIVTILGIMVGQFYAVTIATAAWGAVTGVFGAIVGGLMAIRAGFMALMLGMGPIGWILLGITALVMLMIWKWDWLKQAAVDAWDWIKQAAKDTWEWIKNHWELLATILFGPFGLAVSLIVNKWRDLMAFFRRLVEFMKRIADAILAPFKKVGDIVNPLLGKGNPGSNPLSQAQPRFSGGSTVGSIPGGWTGGTVTSGGAMVVGERGPEIGVFPTGTRIIPNNKVAGFKAGGGGDQIVEEHHHHHVYLDGKPIAESTTKIMANRKARK